MERESFIFYKSFYDAIKEVDLETQAKVYNAIFEYEFYNIEVKLDGIEKALFTLIKPQLEANNKRYENGKKGGRPITKEEPNHNLTITKVKPNKNVNVNDNVNVNNNDKKNIKKKYGIYKRILLTDYEYSKLCLDFTKDVIDNQITLLDEYVQSNNNKNKYTDFNLVLRKSLKDNWFTKTSEFKKKETFDEILDRACKSVEERNKL